MDFHFSQEEQNLLDQIHDFAVRDVAPLAAELDREERFPAEALQKLRQMQMMGVCYPKEVGGRGCSYLVYIAMVEELAKYCAATSIMFAAHHSLGAFALSALGTPAQKEKYLRPLVTGEKLGAFAATEPGAGTDLGSQQTRAEDKGDHWLLNGSKIFITNGFYADIYFVSAVTDPSQKSRGISAFIVEKGTPGFTFGKKEEKMGIRGSATYELIFQDCCIPKENLLGELSKGYKMALTTLDGGRISVAAQAVGIAQGAIDQCKEYVTGHDMGGQRIAQYHRAVPIHPVPAGGDADKSGCGPAAGVSRGPGQTGRRALCPGGRHEQTVRLPDRGGRDPPLHRPGGRGRRVPGISL